MEGESIKSKRDTYNDKHPTRWISGNSIHHGLLMVISPKILIN